MYKSRNIRIIVVLFAAITVILIITFLTDYVYDINTEEILSTATVQSLKNLPADVVQKEVEQVRVEIVKQTVAIEETSAVTLNSCYSAESQIYNKYLYALCEKYFKVDCYEKQLTPFVPMALSIVETGTRSDPSVTLCALYPSRVVPINSVDDIDNFNILAVLSSATVFSSLGEEYSTLHRGPLQMGVDYGVHKTSSLYTLLGTSEEEALKNIDINNNWATHTYKQNDLTLSSWLSTQYISSAGDRFRIKDAVLRTAMEFSDCIKNGVDEFFTDGDLLTVSCMLATSHNTGCGAVYRSCINTKVGAWKSSQAVYNYCTAIASEKFVSLVTDTVLERISEARSKGKVFNPICDQTLCDSLLNKAITQGILLPMSNYSVYSSPTTNTRYPVEFLYSYIALLQLYDGR